MLNKIMNKIIFMAMILISVQQHIHAMNPEVQIDDAIRVVENAIERINEQLKKINAEKVNILREMQAARDAIAQKNKEIESKEAEIRRQLDSLKGENAKWAGQFYWRYDARRKLFNAPFDLRRTVLNELINSKNYRPVGTSDENAAARAEFIKALNAIK